MRGVTLGIWSIAVAGVAWAAMPSCKPQPAAPSLCCKFYSEDCELERECLGLERDACWPCGTYIGDGDSGLEVVGADEDREALEEAIELQRQMGCSYYDLAVDDPQRQHLASLLETCRAWWEIE